MADVVMWVKPTNARITTQTQRDTRASAAGTGTSGRGPCPHKPYASVKLNYADYQPVQSACVKALEEISQRYGFPIPQQQGERVDD
ncbi:hypothetical protein [Nonomuraea sp. NPDC005692]|uniref:hypothetical protein n=1 Tax=Nonomuraea sp. NPDC005692 TaxID=3157168 RepID=UPI00340859FE